MMIKRRNRGGGPALGQDAFLDVVANLVAILIILVVVLGSKSQEIVEAVQVEQAAAPVSTIDEGRLQQKFAALQTEMNRAQAAFEESERFEATILQDDQMLEAMDRERGKMIDLLELMKAAWAEKQTELDKSAVDRARALTEQTVAQAELKQLAAARSRLEKSPEPVVAIDHLPTPMARTVFGEELHFRLKAGRLSVVPIERLFQEFTREAQRMFSSKKDGEKQASVGPVQGYIAHIELTKSSGLQNDNGRVGMGSRIELDSITFEPLQEPHGETMETILARNGSQLDIALAGRNPDRTTITVWVYPDSFADFRRLKEHLYSRGYATAARPLESQEKITASPHGSRSQAQ